MPVRLTGNIMGPRRGRTNESGSAGGSVNTREGMIAVVIDLDEATAGGTINRLDFFWAACA